MTSMEISKSSSDSTENNGIDYRDSQSNPSVKSQHSDPWLESEDSMRSDSSNCTIGNVLSSSIYIHSMDTSGNAPTGTFPFFDLPSEIRLIVYRMAFCRNEPILFRTCYHGAEVEYDNHSDDEGLHHTLLASHDHSVFGRQRGHGRSVRKKLKISPPNTKPCQDPLVPQLLRVCRKIYQEARPILYSENTFVLELDSAARTLTSLSQPSRSSIKHLNLSVPTHHDIIEGFADLVRLHLRYCWGLKRLTLTLPHFFPQDRYAASRGTNVYANSFHILRWLPQGTEVVLDGGATDEIRRVILDNTRMGQSLDKVGTCLVICPEF
jgi:hypothetical protein